MSSPDADSGRPHTQTEIARQILLFTRPGIRIAGIEVGHEEYADLIHSVIQMRVGRSVLDSDDPASLKSIIFHGHIVRESSEPGVRLIVRAE